MNRHFVYFRCWPGFATAFPSDCCNHLADDEIGPALLERVREMREHDDPVARQLKRRQAQITARPTQRDMMTGAKIPLSRLTRPGIKQRRRRSPEQEEILLVAQAAGWTKVPFFRFFQIEGFEDCLWSKRCYVHYAATSQSAKNLTRQLQRSFCNEELGPRFGFVAASDFERALQANIEVVIDNLRTEPASFWSEDDSLLPLAKAVAAVADELRPLGAEVEQVASKGMSWQKAKDTAERHVKRNNNVFPGVNALARFINCSASTMFKAIKNSRYLTARKAEHENHPKKPKEVALTTAILEGARQKSAIEPRDVALDRLRAEQRKELARDKRQDAKWQHTRTPSD